MDEQIFLQGNDGVLVTSSRVEIKGQTFATRNIGSVKVEAPGMSKLAIVIAIIGAGACVGGAYPFGIGALAVGIIWAYTTAQKRRLKLMAGGGEVLALETSNAPLAERVRAAIATAIAAR